jgi:hypothetical protein
MQATLAFFNIKTPCPLLSRYKCHAFGGISAALRLAPWY